MPESTRFDAHQWIGLRVEIRGPAEHFQRNRVTLQPIGSTCQRLLNDELQKPSGTPCVLEGAAVEDARELRPDLIGKRVFGGGCAFVFGHPPTSLFSLLNSERRTHRFARRRTPSPGTHQHPDRALGL
jgi:hypothetical protein